MTLLLNFHILCGSILLILGLAQLVLPKRGRRHRSLGIIYVSLMVLVSASAISLSIIRIIVDKNLNSLFFLIIGFFSLYLAGSGYFSARLKNTVGGRSGKVFSILGLSTGIGFILISLVFFVKHNLNLALISLVFGIIQTQLAVVDIRLFVLGRLSKKYGQHAWLFGHLGKMIGSFIAATTAFLVNAVEVGPPIPKWLGPTVIGFVLIAGFNQYYQKKFNLNKKKTDEISDYK